MAMPLPMPTFTVDQLDDFPDDGNRYELLEGHLLVTPMPSLIHQAVLGRLFLAVGQYLATTGLAFPVSPGVVERAPRTHLEPDILVLPVSGPLPSRWPVNPGWWLAVEALSPSSRIYDINFKLPVYLKLGVREVWIVDSVAKEIHISTNDGSLDLRIGDTLRWHPPEMPEPLELDLTAIFREVP